jgi:hypothetical protein
MTNSEQKQFSRNEELVKREVYACVTPLANFIINCDEIIKDRRWGEFERPFSWDDVENLYAPCGNCDEEGDNMVECTDPQPQEVYEWWAVSPWLFEELRKRGEPVIDTFPHLWGRTTTGQAIALDSAISDIQREHKYAQGGEE